MDSNLMSSSGARLYANKRKSSKPLYYFVIATSIFRVFILFIVGNEHLYSITRMVFDSTLNVIAIAIKYSRGYRSIFFKNFAFLKHTRQFSMSLFFLGDENHSRSIAI